MARPARLTRDESRARTRRRLLEAAADVFARRGYHGASVDDVAEAAGFTKGAVYYNFTSKEELFLALAQERATQLAERIEEALSQSDTLEGKMRTLAEMLSRRKRPEIDLVRLELELSAQALREPRLRRLVGETFARAREAIASLVESQLGELGLTPPLPSGDMAAAIVALSIGLSVQQQLDSHAVDPAAFASTVAILLGAAQAAPDP